MHSAEDGRIEANSPSAEEQRQTIIWRQTIKVISLNVEGVLVTAWEPGLDIPERIKNNGSLPETAEMDAE